MTTQMHEPNPEFARHLEWQIATAVRRQARFAEPVRTYGYTKYLAAAAVIIVAMMVGAGGVAAAGRIQDNQQKQQLVAEQRSQIQVAQLQLKLAEDALQLAKRRVDTGAAPQSVVTSADADVRMAAAKVDRANLDLIEIQASGHPIRDDVTSPVVNGRDFVLERLWLDLKSAALSLTAAEQLNESMHKRYDVGLLTQVELMESDSALLKAQAALRSAQDAIELRQRFVAGGLKPEDAARQKSLAAARSELLIAENSLALAQKRLELMKTKVAIGMVDERDSLYAQLDVLSRKADITALQARIAKLERGGN